jgi:PAS domain S-box-containing protein
LLKNRVLGAISETMAPASHIDISNPWDRSNSPEQELARLRAENLELRKQLELRDLALDATQSFFVITRIEGADRHIVVYCNRSVAEQHGVAREDLIGKHAGVLTGWQSRNGSYRTELDSALRAGRTFHYEDEVGLKDGNSFVLGVSIRPIFDQRGELTHAVAIGADITAKREEARKKQDLQDRLVAEMKERERVVIELQLAQKLESVGRLAAGIAHEINTPIQYVGDSADFLHSAFGDVTTLLDAYTAAVKALPPGPAADAQHAELARLAEQHDLPFIRAELPRAFERIFDGVGRVSTIVKAMKEFAHPDSQEQNPADLNHALETTLLVASNEYKYIAKVRTEFGPLPSVVCNIGELNQVFLNLIVNAAHAIHDAGKDCDIGEIRVATEVAGDQAIVRIRDNGCGIPPDNLSKLYDPFFTTKEVGRGTGQGLSIAHAILVDKHEGAIEVSSEVGVGTEFVLKIPVNGRSSGVSA